MHYDTFWGVFILQKNQNYFTQFEFEVKRYGSITNIYFQFKFKYKESLHTFFSPTTNIFS